MTDTRLDNVELCCSLSLADTRMDDVEFLVVWVEEADKQTVGIAKEVISTYNNTLAC